MILKCGIALCRFCVLAKVENNFLASRVPFFGLVPDSLSSHSDSNHQEF
jgi:hypothetical protein